MSTLPRFSRFVCLLPFPLILLCGCATNPVTGQKQFSLVSSGQELQMGREGHQAVLQEYGLYNDAKLQAYVDSVGHRLARVSHLPNLEWHFTLLDDPTVNAFALPGGYIYITRGILAYLNSEAQLAGVLGHEIGHVTARHTARRVTQQELAGLGLGVASIFSEGFQRYSSAAQQALSLVFLKYSRDDETQADQLGVDYSTKAGYDSREIPATYAMLKRVGERAGQRMPAFLSTHPDPGDRENRTRALATQATVGKTGLVIRGNAHIERLEGVVYGTDPRQGYFDGTRFYHPELGFEITFTSGWKTQNSRSAVVAVEAQQRAGMQLGIAKPAGSSPADHVRALASSGQITDARGGSETIGGWPAWVGNVVVTRRDGSRAILATAFVQRRSDQMFEIVGSSAQPGDALEAQIFAAARSLRSLTDPSRLAVKPDRVHVVRVARSGPFEQVVQGLGPQAVDVEETAIINNVQRDENVLTGQVIKTVLSGRR